MAKAYGFKAMFACCVSILTSIGDRCVAKHYGENEGIYVLHSFAFYITCTTSFDLWMFHGGHDTFTMVVNFINNLWEPTHFIVGIFKVHNTTCAPWQTM
jgi:hypothetical protein